MIVIKIICTVLYLFGGWMLYKLWVGRNVNTLSPIEVSSPVKLERAKIATSDLDFELFIYGSELQLGVSKIGHKYQEDFMKAVGRNDVKETQINLGKSQAVSDIINYIYEESEKHIK